MSYRQFIFESYRFDADSGRLDLHYSYDGELRFTESFSFNFPFAKGYNQEALDKACFGLFMIAGTSYYKAYLAPEIVIRSGGLTTAQADFFDHVYRHGYGELYVQNHLTPPDRLPFPIDKEVVAAPITIETKGAIVPIAGGKDSLVSAELLRSADIDFETWTLSHTNLLQPLLERIQADHLAVERSIDPQIAGGKLPGAYNGHIPFSALVGFSALISAILRGRQDLVLSNESSAGEINLEYHGLQVNHQYSKTLEFERLLQEYITANITPSIRYFSLLRPVSELRIAELFCNRWLGKYQGVFTSCNRNFKQGNDQPLHWCGECPKCAFVFLIFAPFIPKQQLVELFGGQNLFTKPDLEHTYRELLGIQGHKPFDCVGEVRECREAVVMARATGEYPELNGFEFPAFSFDYKALQAHAMPVEYYQLLVQQIGK